MTRTWRPEEIYALGVRTDLVTACSIVYGCGRTKAYELLAARELDFPVLRAGHRYVVPMKPILELLGLDPIRMGEAPADTDAAVIPPGLAAPIQGASHG